MLCSHPSRHLIRQLELLSPSDLYDSNKTFCNWLSDGFQFKREDPTQKDLYIQLIDYSDLAQMCQPKEGEADVISTQKVEEEHPSYHTNNILKIVNQLGVVGRGLGH